MWIRVSAGITAMGLLANGLDMLLWPLEWYHSLASVEHTGPFNAHFVRDIGVAYLASALGVGLSAWRTDWLLPAGSVALVFLGIHAGLHLMEWSHGDEAALHAGWVDHVGVYLPPLLLSAWMLLASRRRSDV